MKILLLFVIFCAYNVSFAQEIEKIEIPKPSGYNKNLKLSEIASKIDYIPLETNAKALLSDHASSTLSKDFIFTVQGGALLQFQRNGKFLRQINLIGKGPAECYVRHYTFDEKNQVIYIYNHYVHNILVFGFDGKYQKTIRDPFDKIEGGRVEYMHCDQKNGNSILFFDNTDGKMQYKYAVMDREGKILHHELNYDQYTLKKRILESNILPPQFYTYQDNIHYWHYYNDTVFRINADYKCVPKYVIRIPDRLTLEEAMKTGAFITPYSELGNKNTINSIYENNLFLFITYSANIFNRDRIKHYWALYDKQNNKLINDIHPEFINDLDGGLNIRHFYNDGSYMWNMLQPIDLKEKLTASHFAKSKALYPDQQRKLKSLIDRLDVEDNPVLIIITLK
ncbi:MAG: 6-bladed beta-propeller [Bacteroidales bacterium]|jgi:hypothetical protein|nr:6-bladed beta-propeller [Bacteroidales bacterium]